MFKNIICKKEEEKKTTDSEMMKSYKIRYINQNQLKQQKFIHMIAQYTNTHAKINKKNSIKHKTQNLGKFSAGN